MKRKKSNIYSDEEVWRLEQNGGDWNSKIWVSFHECARAHLYPSRTCFFAVTVVVVVLRA